MKTIKKNPSTAKLISELKALAIQQEVKLWKRIATDLEKPTRQQRVVNIYKINENSADNEIIIVPGKVLGVGELKHKVTVAAISFSTEAKEKIDAQGKTMSITELMKQNPKGLAVRILG
jgi:large subunit ribosomal protein L18e